MKKKKDKKKITKKQIIILIVVTIVLGILCYFISTEITKSIIDHKTMEENLKNEEYPDLIEPDTISNISLNGLINNFNEINEEDIDINSIVDNKTNMNDTEIEFITKDDNISIISINFNKKSNKVKKNISNMIIASNQNIDEETTELIYNRVFETLGNTSDKENKTSEFFQYQGLEFSLKEYKSNDYKYSFRIGRIVEVEQEENEEE